MWFTIMLKLWFLYWRFFFKIIFVIYSIGNGIVRFHTCKFWNIWFKCPWFFYIIYVNSKLYLKRKSMKILTIFIVSYYMMWSIIVKNLWSNKTIKKCDLFYLLNEMLKVKMFMTILTQPKTLDGKALEWFQNTFKILKTHSSGSLLLMHLSRTNVTLLW